VTKAHALHNSCPSAEAATRLESWRAQEQGADVAPGTCHIERHEIDLEHCHDL
jgi:hypothetical protein